MEKPDRDHPGWKQHEEEQRERWLELSALERLRWLDGAKRFAALATSALDPQSPRRMKKRPGD